MLFSGRREEIDLVILDIMMPVTDVPATIQALLEPKPFTAQSLLGTLHDTA